MTKEEKRLYLKAYYEKNKIALLIKQRMRNKRNYEAKPEAYAARSEAWRAANPERMKELQLNYRLANPGVTITRSREWYAANKPRAAMQARIKKLASYGLTEAQYQAMLEGQDGKCAICGSRHGLASKKHPLYVDHCHSTGKVRGLLCNRCNAGLGMFQDQPALLVRALNYLSKSSSGATSTTSSTPSSEP